jgi:uncharacterized repeat protein (TIGR01451 family)
MAIRSRLAAAMGAGILSFGIAGLASAGSLDLTSDRALSAAQGCGIVPLDVELILDNSGSMGDNESAGHSRMYWAQQAADQLVDSLDSTGGVGASGIHHVGVTRFSGTTSTTPLSLGGSDAAAVKGAIDALVANGNTPLKLGMATGAADMNANARNAVGGEVMRVIILLTDGRPNPDGPTNGSYATNNGSQRPTAANADDFLGAADRVYSIAVGTGGSGSSNVDLGLMQLLDKPDGHYFNVVDASNLGDLFADIFTEISCPPHLVVSKAVDKDSANPGDTLNYTISVSNDGGSDATGVDVNDDISALLAHGTFGSCDHGCSNDADSVDWTGLNVDKGGSIDLHFSIDLAADGWDAGTTHLPNTVLVASSNCSADTQDPDCSTDTIVEVAAVVTEPPATEPPATEPPATEPPATEPPATEAPSFEQSQAGETDAPTLPNTSAVNGERSSAPADSAWLLVVGLGVVMGLFVVLTPAPARRRR